MSRAKWILAGVTLALVLLTLWAVRDTGQRTGYVAHAEKLFPDLPAQAATVRRIEIRSAGQQVTLQGSGSDWKVVDKHDFPADPAKVRALLEGLAGLTLIEPRTADPARHAALDLAAPDTADARGVLVRVLGESDTVLATVLLGKPRAAAGQGPRQLFLRRPDEDQTWLAEGAGRRAAHAAAVAARRGVRPAAGERAARQRDARRPGAAGGGAQQRRRTPSPWTQVPAGRSPGHRASARLPMACSVCRCKTCSSRTRWPATGRRRRAACSRPSTA